MSLMVSRNSLMNGGNLSFSMFSMGRKVVASVSGGEWFMFPPVTLPW